MNSGINLENRHLASLKNAMHCVTINRHIICILFFSLIILEALAGPQPVFSGGEDSMEEIMDGFDEENDTDADEMDSVLDGFDQEDDKVSGQENENDRDILDGFDDQQEDVPSTNHGDFEPGGLPLSIDGHLKLAAAYNFSHKAPDENQTDWRGLSTLRPEFLLQAELTPLSNWKLYLSGRGFYDAAYRLNGRAGYTEDFIDHYETELEWKDTYISGSLTPDLDLKLGRQIVVWGKSDNLRITDVLNPMDLREPGLTDIEDLRLPVCMSRADYYLNALSVTGIAVHETRFNKLPELGSDFFPLQAALPDEKIPANTLNHTQYAFAVNGIFSGWDMSVYWADIYNHTARIKVVSTADGLTIMRVYDRINMLGAAANIALGNFLFKSEGAYFSGIRFFNADKEFSRLDALVGVEYTGWNETTIGIELADSHLFEFDTALEADPDGVKEDEYQFAVRVTREFLNDTLTLTLLLNVYGASGQDGAFERFSAEYALTDSVTILGGVMFYQSGNVLEKVDDNDRLMLEVKYFF